MLNDFQRLHGVCTAALGGIEIPTLPVSSKDNTAEYTTTSTDDLSLVSDYTGMNFNELMVVDCITFKMLLRDAFINKMRQTEEGRDYLENCWLMKQTKPDRARLKEFKEN